MKAEKIGVKEKILESYSDLQSSMAAKQTYFIFKLSKIARLITGYPQEHVVPCRLVANIFNPFSNCVFVLNSTEQLLSCMDELTGL